MKKAKAVLCTDFPITIISCPKLDCSRELCNYFEHCEVKNHGWRERNDDLTITGLNEALVKERNELAEDRNKLIEKVRELEKRIGSYRKFCLALIKAAMLVEGMPKD